MAEVKALACEPPAGSRKPLARWTCPELAREAAAAGIVASVSASTVRRWLASDEYLLTDAGKAIEPVLRELQAWGEAHAHALPDLCDTLLSIAEEGAFRPLWSEQPGAQPRPPVPDELALAGVPVRVPDPGDEAGTCLLLLPGNPEPALEMPWGSTMRG
ncbi:MAG: putative transposase [Actinomycetia bacterium]|nr:putative transposase [Actinomycetes bacterium]